MSILFLAFCLRPKLPIKRPIIYRLIQMHRFDVLALIQIRSKTGNSSRFRRSFMKELLGRGSGENVLIVQEFYGRRHPCRVPTSMRRTKRRIRRYRNPRE